MDCPKCLGRLQEKYMEKIKIDVCFVCEGIWFDSGEFEEIIKRDSRNFDFLNVDRDEFDGKEAEDLKDEFDKKIGECPKCADGTLLEPEKYEGVKKVNVDICPKGHGLWLDGGEIHQLRDRGLVDLKDQFNFFWKCIKLGYSKKGREQIKALKKEVHNQENE